MGKELRYGRRIYGWIMAFMACLTISACVYEVPITENPTRTIDARLIGDWHSAEGDENMKVRKLDDSFYIISYQGMLFRGYHSDVGDVPFLSVQDIDTDQRKYIYVTWLLSDNGQRLELRRVSKEIVPEGVSTSAEARKILEKNLHNPELFKEDGKELVAYYTKQVNGRAP